MNAYYFTFRSVTAAQRGQLIASGGGVPSTILRSPAAMAANGCGYCLRVSAHLSAKAAKLLRGSGVQRCYRRTDTGYEEVACDLL